MLNADPARHELLRDGLGFVHQAEFEQQLHAPADAGFEG